MNPEHRRLLRGLCHRLAYAFILTTSFWFIKPHVDLSSRPLRWFLWVVDLPIHLAEKLVPEIVNDLFQVTDPFLSPLFGPGTWAFLPRNMMAYLVVFYVPLILRQIPAPESSQQASRFRQGLGGLHRAMRTGLELWDRILLRIPTFLPGAVHRLAYAYLATLTITVLDGLNLLRVHDYFSYGLQGLLDMPLTITGALFPIADRGFDFWFSNAYRGMGNYLERYLIHMKIGTCTYFLLFYIPDLYRGLRGGILRLIHKVTGKPLHSQPPLDAAPAPAVATSPR